MAGGQSGDAAGPDPGAEHDPADRRGGFLARHREAAERHFDQTAQRQDAWYGEIRPSHREAIADLLAAIGSDGENASAYEDSAAYEILDAACGTGKHFGILAATGHRVFGVDQSARMLEVAAEKWPEVPTRKVRLQDLEHEADLRGRFAALVCTDALEWVLREDWPAVLRGFAGVLRPGGFAYLTVEVPEDQDWHLREGGVPPEALPEEIPMYGTFHHFPAVRTVLGWLADAGFEDLRRERVGGGYQHLLVRRG